MRVEVSVLDQCELLRLPLQVVEVDLGLLQQTPLLSIIDEVGRPAGLHGSCR